MTADVEFEGKDVKDAIKCAGETLGMSLDDIRYDILSYGSTGIFGLVGVKKARIRVTNNPTEKTQAPALQQGREDDVPEDERDLHRNQEKMSGGEARGDRRPHSSDPPSRWQPVPNAEITPEIIAESRKALESIAKYISEDINIVDASLNGRLVLNLVGGNSGALIGKRGQTLEAIQYLVEKIINKGREDRVRILVDVEGYLENRKNNLVQLAGRMADKAKKRGRPTTIGQMNAHDRRIIHLALKDDATVRTQSVGEGQFRKLVIYPRSAPQRRRRGQQPASRR